MSIDSNKLRLLFGWVVLFVCPSSALLLLSTIVLVGTTARTLVDTNTKQLFKVFQIFSLLEWDFGFFSFILCCFCFVFRCSVSIVCCFCWRFETRHHLWCGIGFMFSLHEIYNGSVIMKTIKWKSCNKKVLCLFYTKLHDLIYDTINYRVHCL